MKKDPGKGGDRLISGKLREKAGRAGAVHTTVEVGGTKYAWSYRHGWVVWGKGIKAISISVALQPKRTRELILDLTLKMDEGGGTPSESRVVDALPAAIQSALDAGSDPESRGRAFRHEIPGDI